MSRGNVLKGLLGLGISALFVWLFLRDKNLEVIWQHTRAADYRYLLAYFGILTLIHMLRTLRWGILLRPLDPQLSLARINAASAVGFMGLIVMPFRLGELARPLLISDGRRLRFSNVMPSIIVERAADGMAVALLLLATLPFVQSNLPELRYLRGAALLCCAVFGGLSVFLALAYFHHEAAVRFAHNVLGRFSNAIADKVIDFMENFLLGLRAVPSGGNVAAYFLLTATYWCINGLGMGILARGFGIELSVLGMFTLLGVLIIGLMIPAGPGMVGTFQYFTELGLRLFVSQSVVDGAGAAYSSVLWGAQLTQMILFGLVFAATGGISLSAFRRSTS